MLSGWSRERYLPYVFLEVKVSLCCVNAGTQPFCLRGEMPSPRCRALSAASACDDAQPFFRSRVSWEDSVPFRSAGRHSPLSRRRPFPLPGADTFLSAPPGKAGRSGGRGAEVGGTCPSLAHCAVRPLKASASLGNSLFLFSAVTTLLHLLPFTSSPFLVFDSSLWFDQTLPCVFPACSFGPSKGALFAVTGGGSMCQVSFTISPYIRV